MKLLRLMFIVLGLISLVSCATVPVTQQMCQRPKLHAEKMNEGLWLPEADLVLLVQYIDCLEDP